jgi:hypothetical protein
MKRLFVGLLALGLVITSGAEVANAQSVIGLVGTWTGTAQAIVDGAQQPTGASSRPAGPYQLRDFPLTLRVDGQDGSRFWGVAVLGDQSRRIIGTVSADNGRLYIVDTRGYFDGVVMNTDTLEICYRQAGATTALAVCDVVRRQKR